MPQRQPKRRRLWLNGSSYIRLKPQYPNHVWSYDILADRASDGGQIRMLTIIDEYSRKCISINIQRQIKALEVHYNLSELFIEKGATNHIRSDNGSEFCANLLRILLIDLGVLTLFIEPGSP